MKDKLFHRLLLTIIIFFSVSITYGLTAQEILQIQSKTWHISLDADVPGLFPEAIQFAVFERDPYPYFVNEIRKKKKKIQERISKEIDYESKRQTSEIQMSKCWDSMFKQITGDDVSILPSTSRQNYGVGIADDTPSGKKWIVSKMAYLDNRPVCWYFVVEVKIGKETELKLTSTNAYNIESEFKKILEEK